VEREYNPTPHTFTTTQQTPILSAHPTHFHSTLPGHTAAPTLAATLPTTHDPYNMTTTLHTTHIPPYNPHNLPTTYTPLTTLPPLFPPSSTILDLLTRFHPAYPDVVTLSPTSLPTPPPHLVGTLHTGALHWWKPTPTNTSKSTSPTSPFTLPMTRSFAKPFLPPSKAPPSNGSRPSHHTLSTTSAPSHTCLPLTSLAAACTKLLQYHSSASSKNKARCSGHLSIASARLPFAPYTSIKRWYSSAWPSPFNPAPSPTTSTSTHLPLWTSWSCVPPITSVWRKYKPSIQNFAMIMHPLPPTPPHNPLSWSKTTRTPTTPFHQIRSPKCSQISPPWRGFTGRPHPTTTQDDNSPQRRHD